jgi:NTE family protein
VDIIAGSSAGALVGLLKATGYTAYEIASICKTELETKRTHTFIPGTGIWRLRKLFTSSEGLEGKVRRYVGNRALDELPITFIPTACDFSTGNLVALKRGSAVTAVMASMSIPVLAPPVSFQGQTLVDGGICSNLPVQLLLDHGTDLVVAVDVNPYATLGTARRPGLVGCLRRIWEIQRRQAALEQARRASLVIRPNTEAFGFASFDRIDDMVQAGFRAAEEALAQWPDCVADQSNILLA